jgi:hypothetical protein
MEEADQRGKAEPEEEVNLPRRRGGAEKSLMRICARYALKQPKHHTKNDLRKWEIILKQYGLHPG